MPAIRAASPRVRSLAVFPKYNCDADSTPFAACVAVPKYISFA